MQEIIGWEFTFMMDNQIETLKGLSVSSCCLAF